MPINNPHVLEALSGHSGVIRIRVTHQASYLRKPGDGGYYRVGLFDSTVTCTTSGKIILAQKESDPLCMCCTGAMAKVTQTKTQGKTTVTCGDVLTDSQFFTDIDLDKQKTAYTTRAKKCFDWVTAREDERTLDSALEIDGSLRRNSGRVLRRASFHRVWPYTCTTNNCPRHGKLTWLHTPGD